MDKAIYPGSFDPPTMGHLDIIERSSRLFQEVVVAVGKNSAKGKGLFSVEERMEMLNESCQHLGNIRVKSFDGLLAQFAENEGAQALVRGLRAISDFESEFQVAQMNRRLNESLETLFLMTGWEYSYLSSSVVREVASLGGSVKGLVPPPVEERLKVKFARLAEEG